jgi:hypothetical protein
MPFVWTRRPTQVFPQMTDAYAEWIHAQVLAIARRYAPAIAAHMKANAPWQDQTGDARRELFTQVLDVADSMVILLLSHGPNINYSVYLELKFAGRDAILAPTIDLFMPRIWADVRAMLGM